MRLLNILSLVVLSLGPVLSINELTLLSDHAISNRINLIDSTVYVPRLFEAAFKNNATDWMDKCSGGINGEKAEGSSRRSVGDITTVLNVAAVLNPFFINFGATYGNYETPYTQRQYRTDTNAIIQQTPILKGIAQRGSTSQATKNVIYRMCMDLRTNMCWMKAHVCDTTWENKWSSPDLYITRNGKNVYTHPTLFH